MSFGLPMVSTTDWHSDEAEAIDLVDGLHMRLETARCIAASLSEHLAGLHGDSAQGTRLGGEVSAIYLQIASAQALAEKLAEHCCRAETASRKACNNSSVRS